MHLQSSKLILAITTAVFACSVWGQSGPRPQQPPVKPPEPVTLQPASQTPPPAVSSSGDPDTTVASTKITSLIVAGDLIHGYKYRKSNELDIVLKEFVRAMKDEPRPFLAVERAGRMTFEVATERAQAETGAHVIWLKIVTRVDNMGEMIVSHLEYSIIMPQTGRVLSSGTVYPGEQKVVGQGGVMQIPRMPKRSSALMDMKQGAREVTYRLKSTGWF